MCGVNIMKKHSLLAGSLSVLGLVAGVGPAQAATEALTPEVQGTEIQPQVQAQVQTAVPSNSALLALQPVAPEAPFTATAPTLAAPNSINLADASQTVTSVEQLMNPGQPQDQVTSVSQLSDVKPTDWAYQAVQSLVERYGCIVGYPNSTFRGNRAATRYELAAALNACLDVISDRFATKEDLATLRRLQEEFAKELATLKGRVNGLEARTAKLEAQQFSTTTKLQGTAIMSVQAGSLGNSQTRNIDGLLPGAPAPNVNPTVISAVLLSLNTTFNGTDLLQTTLGMGNNGRDTISEGLIGQTDFRNNRAPLSGAPGPYFNASTYYWNEFSTNVFLYRLAYTFKPFKNVTITAGPQFYAADIIDQNSWANAPSSDFGNYFFINNAFIIPYALNYAGGAGGAVQWNPGGGPFTVRALYIASDAGNPVRGTRGDGAVNGFAGDPYQGSIELEYKNTFGGGKNNFAVRLQGTRALVNSLETTALGVNAEATFGRFGVFGRAGYAWLNPDNAAGAALGFDPDPLPGSFPFLAADDNYRALSFMAGVGYKDLLVPGSMVAIAAGAPFITQGRGSAAGVNDRNQVNLEAFYRFPVNDNISITPMFTVIFNPNNSSFNDTIYQGVLRTTFTF
jgi:Carbohydrate-selective porin, OprB family/S-layer homology domain